MSGPGASDIEVELLPEFGARLHRLRVFGHDLLRTPEDLSMHAREPFEWGAYVMAPWCNRMAAGPTVVGDRVVDVSANHTDGTALHGQAYLAPWHALADGSLAFRGGGDAWPWPYETRLRVTTADRVMTIEQTLTNLADTPMPAGLGIHPWFRRPLDVRIDARSVLASNVDLDAQISPARGPFDLRTMQPMPVDLDATWLDVGDPAVQLRWPTLGIRAELRVRSDAEVCIVAASPTRLGAVAIEPETHAPQGLRRFLRTEPGGLHPLEPGATLHLTTDLAFSRDMQGA